jgi:hypothetical protein
MWVGREEVWGGRVMGVGGVVGRVVDVGGRVWGGRRGIVSPIPGTVHYSQALSDHSLLPSSISLSQDPGP